MESVAQQQGGASPDIGKAARRETAKERFSKAAAFLASRQIALPFFIVLVMGLREGAMRSYSLLPPLYQAAAARRPNCCGADYSLRDRA